MTLLHRQTHRQSHGQTCRIISLEKEIEAYKQKEK